MSDDRVVYELSLDLPSLPKGEPVQIPGLGTFENGETHEITKIEHERYRAYHVRQIPVIDEETQEVRGNELENGPTLLQAFKDREDIEVVTITGGGNQGGDD
jgi:hypothetical protein